MHFNDTNAQNKHTMLSNATVYKCDLGCQKLQNFNESLME